MRDSLSHIRIWISTDHHKRLWLVTVVLSRGIALHFSAIFNQMLQSQ